MSLRSLQPAAPSGSRELSVLQYRLCCASVALGAPVQSIEPDGIWPLAGAHRTREVNRARSRNKICPSRVAHRRMTSPRSPDLVVGKYVDTRVVLSTNTPNFIKAGDNDVHAGSCWYRKWLKAIHELGARKPDESRTDHDAIEQRNHVTPPFDRPATKPNGGFRPREPRFPHPRRQCPG